MVALSVAVSPSPSVMVADAVRFTRLGPRMANWSSNGAVVVLSGAWSISWRWVSVTTPLEFTASENTTEASVTVVGAEVAPTITPPTSYRLTCAPLLSKPESLPGVTPDARLSV